MSPTPPTRVPLAEMPKDLQDLLGPGAGDENGLELFERAAHQPEALAAFYRWGEALRDALPARLVEAIALTVATHAGNDYARTQHERAALAAGMTEDEILALERMRGGICPTLAEEEVAAATLARALLEDFGRGASPAMLRVSRLIGEPAAVGCLMAAAYFASTASMANALELRSPAPSPLASPDDVHR